MRMAAGKYSRGGIKENGTKGGQDTHTQGYSVGQGRFFSVDEHCTLTYPGNHKQRLGSGCPRSAGSFDACFGNQSIWSLSALLDGLQTDKAGI